MADYHAESEFERRLDAWAEAEQLEPRADLQRELSRTLRASLKPVKPLPSNGVLLLQFLFAFVACATGLIAILGKSGIHIMTAAQVGGMAAILASGSVFFALHLVSRIIPGNRIALPFWLGLALVALGVGAAMALLFPWRMPGAFVAEGWPCAVLELAIAIPAAAMFWLMARRGALFGSAGLGAALMAPALCLALMADQAQCMFPQAPHLLVWHGGMAAMLIAAGAALGRIIAGRLL